MAPQPLVMSPAYQAVVRSIRELHRLEVEGRSESPEADMIRDAPDAPWESLTAVERKRASGLSEDLYSLSEQRTAEPHAMNPQAMARLNDASEARNTGEWDRALEFLRRWGKYVSAPLASYHRGSIWLLAGDPETALLFLEHAAESDPKNGKFVASYLHVLEKVDHDKALTMAESILAHADSNHADAVVYAAAIVLEASRSASHNEAIHAFRRLLPILEKALVRIEAGDEGRLDQASHSVAAQLLGACHHLAGDSRKAVDYLTRGLQVNPQNAELLYARGILLYGSSPRAITDFELAIAQGFPRVWPYFFLTHHYLINHRFEECRLMSERASRIQAPDSVKSELAEWLAISRSELGYPAEVVRAAFEQAIRLDPSNDRAKRNLAIFEEAVQPAGHRVWELRTVEAVGIAGLSAWPPKLVA
jgi:tetratricopeptide (TPR) repeat protein